MMYVKLKDGIPVQYTVEDILKENPDAVIFRHTKKPAEDLLENYGFYPLISTDRPEHYDVVEEIEPIQKDGVWYQQWEGRKYNKKERALIFTDRDTLIKRRDTCNACPEYNKKLKTCGECGCIMPLKYRIKHFSCPIGKW